MAKPTSKSELLELIIDHHRQMERYLFYFIKDSQGKFIAGDRPKFSKKEMVQPGVAGQYSLKEFPASYRQALAAAQSIPEDDLFTPGRYA